MAYIGKKPTDAPLTSSDVADGIITEAKMADDAISLAELKSGTDGNIISYDASGNPVAIATGSDGQVLTSTGAGSPPAFEAVSGGKIGQVLQAVKTDLFTCTASSFTDVTDITIDITPAATSSKILVNAFLNTCAADEIHVHFRLVRDSTNILIGDASSNHVRASVSLGPIRNSSQSENFSITYLDSPSTTSATTYKIQMQNQQASVTSYINGSSGHADNSTFAKTTSTITVMEVLA